MDNWYDNLQVNIMYVCARSMVKKHPDMALEIAMWHISLLDKRFTIGDLTYHSAQKFHIVKKLVESNVNLVPAFKLKNLLDKIENRKDFFTNHWRIYTQENTKIRDLASEFTASQDRYDDLQIQFEINEKTEIRMHKVRFIYSEVISKFTLNWDKYKLSI